MGDNYDFIDTGSDINDDTDDASDGVTDTTDTSADTEGTSDISSDSSTDGSSDTDTGDNSTDVGVESSDDSYDISDTDGFEYASEILMEGYDYTISEDDDFDDSNDATAKVDDIIEENDASCNDTDELEKIEDVITVEEDISDTETDDFEKIEDILIVEEDDADEDAEENADIFIDDQLTIDDWQQYRDYVRYTPKNYGTWESGVRGDGLLIPDDNPELAEKLKDEYGVDGLEYDLGKLDTDCVSLMDFELSEEDAEIADRDLHRAMVIQGLADLLTRYEDEYVLDEFDEEVDEHLDEEEKAEAERIYDLIGEEGLTELYEGRVPPELAIHHDNEEGCMRVIESDIHKYFHHKGGYAEHSINDDTAEET